MGAPRRLFAYPPCSRCSTGRILKRLTTSIGRQYFRALGVGFAALSMSCGTWSPVAGRFPENAPGPLTAGERVTATSFGNTTLLVSDGRTRLLIDGFVSRLGGLRTLFGRIGPDESEIRRWLGPDRIGRVDAILVGHAHHDHSLDAPTLSRIHNAPVYGSRAYSQVHEGQLGAAGRARLHLVNNRDTISIGRFDITFRESGHVEARTFPQRLVDGTCCFQQEPAADPRKPVSSCTREPTPIATARDSFPNFPVRVR